MFVKAAISHLSKLKSIIRLSTYEARYIAIYKVRKKAIWLRYLLAELRFSKRFISVRLYTNN